MLLRWEPDQGLSPGTRGLPRSRPLLYADHDMSLDTINPFSVENIGYRLLFSDVPLSLYTAQWLRELCLLPEPYLIPELTRWRDHFRL